MTRAGPAAVDRLEAPTVLDAPSLEDLYGELYQPLLRLAYLLTGSRPVAEDVVQDCFARLHRHWDHVRYPAAYLRTSVVNGCRAHHRRAHREQAHFSDLVRSEVAPETPLILDALAGLAYRQRAAIVLRYWEDWPEADIAEFLRCRPATVRSLVARGLKALREVMAE